MQQVVVLMAAAEEAAAGLLIAALMPRVELIQEVSAEDLEGLEIMTSAWALEEVAEAEEAVLEPLSL
jgi:hypothetical protein